MGSLLNTYRKGLHTLFIFALLNICMMVFMGFRIYQAESEIKTLRQTTCTTAELLSIPNTVNTWIGAPSTIDAYTF